MLFGYFTLLVALIIETVGAYYSITGLAAIFSGAVIPILIMGASLEVGKVTAAVWLKIYWERAGLAYKIYLVPAVAFLMLLTSMGIFGFLSKAHSDQSLVSGDSQAKVAIYDEKIRTARDNIETNRRALKQMDESVDQVMGRSTDEKGADKAVALRRNQQKERQRLLTEIDAEQKKISQLTEQRAPLAAEFRKVESEVGPIKYIAALIYGDNPDANLLEAAVRWVIILIVAVFDPLALVLILAAQQSIRWAREEKQKQQQEEQLTVEEPINTVANHPPVETADVDIKSVVDPEVEQLQQEVKSNNPSDGDSRSVGWMYPPNDVKSSDKEPEPELATVQEDPKILAAGIDVFDRPGDYINTPEPVAPQKQPEAAPGRNRGVMYTTPAQADNDVVSETPLVKSGFGNNFPLDPNKGDTYLRVDSLPNRLYKFNGNKWIEIDKTQTDTYVSEEYLQHIISEINAGKLDIDTLTEVERDQLGEYLNRNK